jgi:hypothetical protein
MKLLTILAVILVLAIVGPFSALAAPFLVADPPDTLEQVLSYKIYKDGVYAGTSTGEILSFDLQGVTPGTYDWTAEACNVWGCSELSNPYISPLEVAAPQGLRGIQ